MQLLNKLQSCSCKSINKHVVCVKQFDNNGTERLHYITLHYIQNIQCRQVIQVTFFPTSVTFAMYLTQSHVRIQNKMPYILLYSFQECFSGLLKANNIEKTEREKREGSSINEIPTS